ncbi:MAG TPA: vanadium-dependent haloperoxidase [Planctomycetota bacterium]
MKAKNTLLCITLAVATGSACRDSSNGSAPTSTPVSSFDSGLARDWFGQLVTAIDTENLNPPEASRRIGYAGVAFYEALVGGMPGHNSLGGQLNDLGSLPAPPAGLISWPAAANAAVSQVLAAVFATASAPTLQAFADLEAQIEADLATTVDAATLDRSIQHGQAIAMAITDWIAGDEYAQWNDCAFTPPVGEGLWEPTPPAFVPNPLEPCWGNLRPFALLFSAECAPLSHPPFSKSAGSAFANEAQEVYDVGNNLTPEQMDIALFWADGGGTLTPPGHWVSITNQVLAQEDLALDVAAEAYARVGIAVADAFIACWEIKFHFNLLRPVTYIQDPAGPIADAGWTSSIGTPPFAEYTSGHSTQSGAASLVLRDLLGDVPFTDHTHDGAGLAARSFDSFTEAADEAAISRLYGGIHFRAAIERGIEQGECIGRVILDNVQFRD